MFDKTTPLFFLRISSALLALMLLLSACNVPANLPTPGPAEATTDLEPTETPTEMPADGSGQAGISVNIDLNGVAQDISSQVVEAVPASDEHPWWEVMPQYTLLTLGGYPVSRHLLQPQIFVYPVQDLGVNENAGQVAQSLQSLLQNRQPGDSMPYLPPYNAAQVIHAQVKFMDFKNGSGVRFLTQFDQAVIPINNYELHYTYQGLTSDGKYYVAAVLPVNLEGLPADGNIDLYNPPANFLEDFSKYLSDTVAMLDGQPANAFKPSLDQLDAMMGSLEIK